MVLGRVCVIGLIEDLEVVSKVVVLDTIGPLDTVDVVSVPVMTMGDVVVKPDIDVVVSTTPVVDDVTGLVVTGGFPDVVSPGLDVVP